MINLLPTEVKRDIRAARMNIVLLHYIFVVIGAMVILALFCLTFYVILRGSQTNAVSTNKDNSAKAASYASIRKEADNYRNNLTIANKIFANSTSYTDIIVAITKLIPDGVVLDGLTLNSTTLGQQTSFSAHAKTYDDANKLKENFQDPKLSHGLFSNVYFQNLSANPDSGSDSYPIAIVLSAKLNKVDVQ